MLRKKNLRLQGKSISALLCVCNICLDDNKYEIDLSEIPQAILLFHLLNLLSLNLEFICKVSPQAQV